MSGILIVDDEEGSLATLERLVSSQGHQVTLARSGPLALAALAARPAELVLLDARMPEMDGWEVCRRIRANPATAQAGVILLIERSQPGDAAEGFAAGADDFLNKPIEEKEAMVRLRASLGLLERLRQAEHELVRLEKMAALGQLVAGIAHEMNSPVGTLLSNGEILSKALDRIRAAGVKLPDPDAVAKMQTLLRAVGEIASTNLMAGRRIGTIFQSLKNFARLDEADLKKVNLHDGLDSTLTLLQHRMGQRIRVAKDYGPLPELLCRAREINQVFLCLLSHACRAIQGEGEIRIETRREGEEIHIRISDTGSGLDAESLRDTRRRRFPPRTGKMEEGLEIPVAERILQEHRGALEVESEPGRGTSFRIRLPLEAR